METEAQTVQPKQKPVPYVVTMGADPEIFALNRLGNLLPAFKFLPPQRPRSKLYADGFAIEGYIEPAHSPEELVEGIREFLERAHKAAKRAGGTLTLQNCLPVPRSILQRARYDVIKLGCNPSANAYGMAGEIPDNGRSLPWRSAGGHLHFGLAPAGSWDEDDVIRAVKHLDDKLAARMVGIACHVDKPVRRKYYGLAGEYRLTHFGFEYRTLSNAWLHNPGLAAWVFQVAWAATNAGLKGVAHTDAHPIAYINHTGQYSRPTDHTYAPFDPKDSILPWPRRSE